MTRILIVEDEIPIARVLADNLEYEGYEVLVAHDGEQGLERALSAAPDLVLLDIMLPGINGYDVCRKMREAGCQTPVIMLTARGEEADKVLGLELGADDYVTKPVGVRELAARVKAVLRRSRAAPTETGGAVLIFGSSEVDFDSYQAHRDGDPVHLSPKAFGILRLLWEREGKAVTRSEILQQVWGYDVYPTTRTVDNHVAELRAGLEADPAAPRHILTVHGVGYRFTTEP